MKFMLHWEVSGAHFILPGMVIEIQRGTTTVEVFVNIIAHSKVGLFRTNSAGSGFSGMR